MRRSWIPVLLLLLCAIPALARAAAQADDPLPVDANDWPWWRGPKLDGSANPDQKPPVSWTADQNVMWKAALPGRSHGSPAVHRDRVYLAACDEATGRQSLLAFDRATGKTVWEAEVHATGAMRKNAKASGASSTPACDGERILIAFANHDAVVATALGLDGKILWQAKVGDYQIHQGYGASPVLYRSWVLVTADHRGGGVVAALDRKTGAVAWKHERPKLPNYVSPIVLRVAGRDQLLLIGCNLISSLDPATGSVLWETAGSTEECVTSTVTDGTHIYSSGGWPRNHLAAVKADGSAKIAWETGDRVYVPSLLIKDGNLYGVLDAGVAACWDAATGRERWKARLGGGFSASPVLVGDRIYATSESGETFVYEANPEKFVPIATSKLGDEVLATPAICGGRIYMRVAQKGGGRRQEFLYCLGGAP